jgi:hypothetical protein
MSFCLCYVHGNSVKLSILLTHMAFNQSVLQKELYNEEVSVKVFNATFNNISVISWRSFSLVEETRVPGENQRPVASH